MVRANTFQLNRNKRPIGDDISQTLARVLERQPDFSLLPANLHPQIVEMLERCLEKDVRNRYGSISDVRVDIQKALADPNGVFVKPVTTARNGYRKIKVGVQKKGLVVHGRPGYFSNISKTKAAGRSR